MKLVKLMNNYTNNEAAMDLINLLSFIIGIKNFNLNVSQNDLQKQTQEIDEKVEEKVKSALIDIHNHLQLQDEKIDYITSLLKNRGDNNDH